MIIIAINCFIIIVNFCIRFDKTLTEIFQLCMALPPVQQLNVMKKDLETRIE